jgi:MerR family transcriptional regulator/heat shock protein HspR
MATIRLFKVRELCVQLDVDEALLRTLEAEGLIAIQRAADDEPVMTAADAERLRVCVVLLRDMDVNLPGVEVVLQMREHLLGVQRQFDEILRSLVVELRKRVERPGE